MKILSLAAVAFAVAAFMGAQAPELAADSTTVQLAQAKKQTIKRLQVRRSADIPGAFRVVGSGGSEVQAVEISCSPASSTTCADDFVAACDKKNGVLSSGDDSVICSF